MSTFVFCYINAMLSIDIVQIGVVYQYLPCLLLYSTVPGAHVSGSGVMAPVQYGTDTKTGIPH